MRAAAAALLAAGLLAGCGAQHGSVATGPGVTSAPCPTAVNQGHGCIYLGIISDLSSTFKGIGVPVTEAQQAFWKRVNQQGGIAGYDIDATTYVKDNKYDPAVHKRLYEQMKGKVLALAQTLGSTQTAGILPDLKADKMLAVPMSFTSAWAFQPQLLRFGPSYCFQAMNAVDYAAAGYHPKSILSVYYQSDYGGDANAGAEIAAKNDGIAFTALPTLAGLDKQAASIDAIVKTKPDLVVLATGPADAGKVVAEAAARGYKGHFFGVSPVWHKSLMSGKAAQAIKDQYTQVGLWKPFAADSPGDAAMRQALGTVDPDDSFVSGWVSSYELKAILVRAAQNGDLTRAGLMKAAGQITSVDFEGIMPAAAGNLAGDAGTVAFRQSVMLKPDDNEFTKVRVVQDFATGPTASGYTFKAPCSTQ
ncbi:MAG: ABC-type branched-chain amino acid transport system periplasmic component-like protein [Actinomycetia bacterium]|nr:ABC-type branched-chain amino acid transport system periplasmic component-like protein [Actinomycetes bacterium]